MLKNKIKIKPSVAVIFMILLIGLLVIKPFFGRWNSGLEASIPSEAPVGAIDSKLTIVQQVRTNVTVVNEFSLKFATYMRENDCSVLVEMLSGKGAVIQEWKINGLDLIDNTYVKFILNNPYRGESFSIRVSSDADLDNAVTLWRSKSNVYAGSRLSINGKETDGTLCFKVNGRFSVSHVQTLRIYNMIVAGLLTALFFCVYLTAFVFKNIEHRFSIVLLLSGLLYLLVMTPHSIPDEERHTNLSELLSNTLLFNSNLSLIPADAYDIMDYKDKRLTFDRYTGDGYTFQIHKQAVDGYIAVIESLFTYNPVRNDEPLGTHFYGVNMFFLSYPVMYLPQALGISVARLLYFNPLQVYFSGRLFNLLFYALVTGYAIKIIPKRFCTLLMALALMPMSLQQAGSYSYDTFSNALSFLLAAYFLRLAFESEQVRLKDFIVLLATGCILAPARMVYTPIVLLVFLIPKEKYPSLRYYRIWSRLIVFVPMAFAALYMSVFGSGLITNTGWISNDKNQTIYTVMYALQHPIHTAGIYLNTLIENTEGYIAGFIGMWLSGTSLPVPLLPIVAYMFILFLSIFDTEGDENASLTVWNRTLMLMVGAAIYVLVLAGLLFAWTSITSRTVEGVQGRYFIPLALPVLAAAGGSLLRYQRDIGRWLVLLAVIINASIINHVIDVTVGL